MHKTASEMASLRAAVIGAGPAGFYATEQLLMAGIDVDIYDVLPTPFGRCAPAWHLTTRRSSR